MCPAGHVGSCFGPIHCFNSHVFLSPIMALSSFRMLGGGFASQEHSWKLRAKRQLCSCLCCQFYRLTTGKKKEKKNPHLSQNSNTNYPLHSLLEVLPIILDKALSNHKTLNITSRALKLLIGNLTESFWPFILACLEMKHFKSKSSSCSGLCYSWNKGFSNSKPDMHFTSTKQRLSIGVTGHFETYQCQRRCHSSHVWLPLGISEIPAEVPPGD